MNTLMSRTIPLGILFLIIFVSGFGLSRWSGKPYNGIVFNAHKLMALGAVVIMAVTIYRINQISPLTVAQAAAAVVTALSFAAAIGTGGMLSIQRTVPILVLRLHQVAPYLTVVSTAATLYLLLPVLRILSQP